MSPDELHARALDLLLGGDTAGGIADLRAYLDARPEDAGAWMEIGTAYAAIDHHAQAVAALRRAVDLDRDAGDARRALARSLRRQAVIHYDARRYDEAAALLHEATRDAPGDARAFYALGVVEEARRDMGAAVAALRAAVDADPAMLDARRTLADALAGLGEHEAAVDQLDAVLSIDRTDERAAHNREVLMRALADMKARRLLGKDEAALAASALIQAGGLRRRDAIDRAVRYAAPLVEVYATFDEARALDAAVLVLTDPARAARTEDDVFQVTVIGEGGRRAAADLGTALTLTFLREALGCPLTTASALYARLLGGAAEVTWASAAVTFTSAPRPGLAVRRR